MDILGIQIQKAVAWLTMEDGENFLLPEEHCPTRDIFQSRLDHMSREMERNEPLKATFPLIAAILGEIGNNAFDHNLGNWRDAKGVYFVYDLKKKLALIADRGQGVLATLRRVKPELTTENEAIKVAFTEVISGRAPEQRGNGLKFVEAVARANNLTLYFYSGDGMYTVNHCLTSDDKQQALKGVLVMLLF